MHVKQLCTEEEIIRLRGAAGSCLFLARETRPDLSGPVSLLQGSFPNPRIEHLKEANRIIRMAHDFSHLKIVVKANPLRDPERLLLATSRGDMRGRGAQPGLRQSVQLRHLPSHRPRFQKNCEDGWCRG